MPECSSTADITAMRKRAPGEFTEHAESERGQDDLVDLLGA